MIFLKTEVCYNLNSNFISEQSVAYKNCCLINFIELKQKAAFRIFEGNEEGNLELLHINPQTGERQPLRFC